MSSLRTHCSDAGVARTRGPSFSYRVKHSTTEPMRFLTCCILVCGCAPLHLIQPRNYQVSKEVVDELEFGDKAVMQI